MNARPLIRYGVPIALALWNWYRNRKRRKGE